MSVPEAKIKAEPQFVEAVLPVPLRRSFTYAVPAELRGTIKLGARLKVPFGKRTMTGYAVKLHLELPADIEFDTSKIKDIIEVSDDEPLITPEILKLTQWTADYYASFWGEMLKASLPAGINTEKVRPKRRKAVRLIRSADTPVRMSAKHEQDDSHFSRGHRPPDLAGGTGDADKSVRSPQQQKIIDLLTANGGEMLFTDVLEQADVGASPINTLAKRGVVEVFVDDVMRDPLAGAKLPVRDAFTLTPSSRRR